MLRLLIDENLDHWILRGLKLRVPHVDYILVREVGMAGFADPELLRWAAEQERIIVTHDSSTMHGYANHLLKSGEPMAGVIIIPDQMAIGRAINDLELMVECYSPAELRDQTNIYHSEALNLEHCSLGIRRTLSTG